MIKQLDRKLFNNIYGDKLDNTFANMSILTINKFAPKFNITTNLHLIRFLAQCKHEVMIHKDGTPAFEENLHFSKNTLMKLSKFWRRREEELEKLLAKKDMRTIMNGWYNGRNGNRPNTDDGFHFIGHGAIMITGRNNHLQCLREIQRVTGETLVSERGMVLDENIYKRYDIFWLLALAYWSVNRLHRCRNTTCVTNKVNRGLPEAHKEHRLQTALMIKRMFNEKSI